MLKDIAIASYVWKPERSCMIVRLTYEIRRKERLSGIHPTICIISLSYRRECTMNVSGGVWDLKLSPMDHHRLLGPGGGSPPTNRAKLDSTTSDTLGKLDDLDSWLRPWVKVPVAGDFQLNLLYPRANQKINVWRLGHGKDVYIPNITIPLIVLSMDIASFPGPTQKIRKGAWCYHNYANSM